MSKILGFVVLFSIISYASTCSNVLNYNNIIVTINYVGATYPNSQFSLTFNNSLPGVAPNDYHNATFDVHSFVIADPSVTAVKPMHLDYSALMGGALRVMNFTVPTSMTGANKCVTMGFIYNKSDKEYYFSGDLSLSTANQAREVAESVEANNHGARGACDITIPGLATPFSGSSSYILYNSFYLKSGTTAISSVTYNAVEGTGQLITNFGSGNTWASIAASTTKSGSVGWNCNGEGTYPINVTVTYTCSGTVYTPFFQKYLNCDASKRSSIASVQSAQSAPATIRADYAIALGAAGVAVAAVAVVAAVVIVRRRTVERIL